MRILLKSILNNSTNFLDIIKARNADSLQFSTYTKPTTLNTIKPEILCHPPEYSTSIEDIFKYNNTQATDDEKEISIIENFHTTIKSPQKNQYYNIRNKGLNKR